jgi:ribosomal protein S20
MSISSVSTGSTAAYTPNTQQKDVRNAFKQMSDAINSGDLQDAQNAFDNLASLLNNNQQATQSTSQTQGQTSSSGSDFSTLLNQIGSALQSGDLDQAKQALTNLQQSAQAGRGGHRHHHHGGGVGGGSGQTASNAASASTDTSSIGGINLSV